MEPTKTCTSCGEVKPLSGFYQRSKNRGTEANRHEAWCKTCTQASALEWRRNNPERFARTRRARHYRKTYGITLDDYESMLAAQGGRCRGCGATKSAFIEMLVVDHDHSTGRVRELLCDQCNLAIGNALDRPEVLRALAAYLDKHHAISKAAMTSDLKGATDAHDSGA